MDVKGFVELSGKFNSWEKFLHSEGTVKLWFIVNVIAELCWHSNVEAPVAFTLQQSSLFHELFKVILNNQDGCELFPKQSKLSAFRPIH